MKNLKCRCGWSGNNYELFVRPVTPMLKVTVCPNCLQALGTKKEYPNTDFFEKLNGILKPENQN